MANENIKRCLTFLIFMGMQPTYLKTTLLLGIYSGNMSIYPPMAVI